MRQISFFMDKIWFPETIPFSQWWRLKIAISVRFTYGISPSGREHFDGCTLSGSCSKHLKCTESQWGGNNKRWWILQLVDARVRQANSGIRVPLGPSSIALLRRTQLRSRKPGTTKGAGTEVRCFWGKGGTRGLEMQCTANFLRNLTDWRHGAEVKGKVDA